MVGHDLGLDRTFDLSRPAVHGRAVRRRVLVILVLVLTVGAVVTLDETWPAEAARPVLGLPHAVNLAGDVLMGLAVVVLLVGVGTKVRAGTLAWDRDPLLDLARPDRTWVRARIAACAPVAASQHPVVAAAAGWMTRQRGTVWIFLGLALEGLEFTMSDGGVLSFVLGLVLAVESLVLANLAYRRARPARRWLTLYAPGGKPEAPDRQGGR